ncbi:STE-domain-containing protein [Trametes cingulata]|nr:STE-domain-containing protein [Trametes cingulata]
MEPHGQGQGQSIADALTNGGSHGGLSRPLTLQERDLLAYLDRLKYFLATAPSLWNTSASSSSSDPSSSSHASSSSASSSLHALNGTGAGAHHPSLNRFLLPNQEYVSCVLWGGLYHITGTDIVRALVFRFEAFGRPVRNMKKFEEGVFSDLRNLKPGVDACLEEPKSPFLDLLFKYQCIRTQKKQKVFYWFSVPHDRLFLDALERDLKREKMGQEPTTVVVGEPALSFTYDPKRSLYEQFSKAHGARDGEGELEAAVRRADEATSAGTPESGDAQDGESGRARSVASSDAEHSASDADDAAAADESGRRGGAGQKKKPSALSGPNSPFFPMFSLFEGSPTYKQRRKKVPKGRKSPPASAADAHHAHAHAHEAQQQYGQGYGAPAPAYREPHLDRFGRDVMRLSAGDMFAAGARGDFGANPDVVVTQKERQRRALEAQAQVQAPFLAGLSGPGVAGSSSASSSYGAQAQAQDLEMEMEMVYGIPSTSAQAASTSAMDYAAQQQQQQQYGHPRPQLEQRHTYPLVDFAQHPQHAHAHTRSGTDPYTLPAAVGQPITTGWTPAASAPGMDAALGMEPPRTKAFVCPLYSCGRMFKRMEHLRRHLRTHTLERPFQCEQCQKRFSRSDNLAQHVRTHERRAAAAAAMGGMMGMGMGMAVGVPEGVEGEVEDDLGEDDLDGELQYMAGMSGITSVRMCEVEVRGPVQEVQGDEEGLLTTTGSVALTGGAVSASTPPDSADSDMQARPEVFYDATGQILRASPETSPYLAGQHSPDAQWATVPTSSAAQQHGSPAPTTGFSTGTVNGGIPLPHTAAARLDASYHTGTMGDYVTSISAPSHKLTFDHAALYPPELALNGPGPIRRHRSATPSIPRYAESIRRPYSAALSDSGNSAGAGTSAPAASRSYHPYAMAGHHPVSHSAQSSPMAYTVPLSNGYDAPAARHAHSHSRSSSSGQLQEQMRHMLGLEQMDAESMSQYAAAAAVAASQEASQTYAGMYRTDSPMPYNGVTEAYEMDMAHQQPAYAVSMSEAQAVQYAAQQQQQQSEYYQHPHHSL